MTLIFKNRQDAGQRLLDEVRKLDPQPEIVLALPRGGVPVAAIIAEGLGVLLDLILVRKVGVPGNPELALGAVSDGRQMKLVLNDSIAKLFGITRSEAEELARTELTELERRRKRYCGEHPPSPLANRHVLVVDDGMATGATARAALRLVRDDDPASITLAIPVASREALDLAEKVTDRIICLDAPDPFMAVGAFYSDFGQTTDEEVIELMKKYGMADDLPKS